MKTFLFDTFNKYKRLSESLDVETTLCNRTWVVFNNSGEKEIYIFQAKGKLLISLNGKVTHATWEYIPANKSLIISGNNQSYMVHAAYVDNILFALNIDGTNEYAFLIEENNKQDFQPQSFNNIVQYFQTKELKIIQEERTKQLQTKSLLKQKKNKEKIQQEKIIENELHYRATEIKCPSGYIVLFGMISFFIGTYFSVFFLLPTRPVFTDFIHLLFYILLLSCLLFILIFFSFSKIRAMKWKKKHPNDPVNKYL